MNIIIPMAGMGKRMRPHTLSIPKPLIKIAGKSIVQRIVEELKVSSGKKIDSIHYVIGNFGCVVEQNLLDIASSVGSKGYIHYQNEALGTAHAVFCAENALEGEVLIAFADTLFVGDFKISGKDEAIVWTMKVQNPELYGVVVIDDNNNIKEFVEKPKEFISDQAIIGIYYFREGEILRNDIRRLIENKLLKSGEYQLTDNLRQLLNDGIKFSCQQINEWLDCGNKEEFLNSSKRLLELRKFEYKSLKKFDNVFVGENVEIINSNIGPFVSIEDNCKIINSSISNSVVSNDTSIEGSQIINSMIGNHCKLKGLNGIVNIGDYSEYENR